jgi:Tol biopolymer transport system component
MDQAARRKVVGAIKNASMPAWSGDGTRLAFVQKTGKRRYRLMTAAVGRATI